MATQIERTTFDHTGKGIESVTVRVDTDRYAAAYAEVLHDDQNRQGWREEIFELSPIKSVQCLYDSRGIIWHTVEYTTMATLPSGQPII